MVDSQAQIVYPYFFPYQANLTQEQALDWELERFYNLCIFQKPTTTPTLNQLDAKFSIGKTLNSIEIGRQFFGSFVSAFSTECLVDWFLRLYFRLPAYLHSQDCQGLSRNISRHGLTFQQFFFQCFLLFFKFSRDEEREQQRKAKLHGAPPQIRVCDEPTDTLFNFKDSERNILIRLLIRTEFPHFSKIWALASSANLSVLHKNANFPALVKEAAESGEIAFWALQFGITRFGADFEDVSILAHLLLLGTVSGRQVEEFLLHRSEEDREKGRNIILIASDHWAKSFSTYQSAARMVTRREGTISSWEKFKLDMIDLMIELNRELPRQNYITIQWAKAAIKIYMEKCYVKKEWTIEQLYDLCYTILKQRNQLRSDIVSAFRKNKDPISAEYWQNFFIDHKIQQFQASILQPKKNQPPKLVYRLNEPDMNEVRPDFLSIPSGVDVFVIDKIPKLSVIEHEIKKCMESQYAVIGMDSEWSPYVLSSRASILQIAFHSVIFILDLDSMSSKHEELSRFIDNLFSNPKIIKIGFQFGEDLIQLRKKLPKCYSLYEPVNLIDISKVVSNLMTHSKKANIPTEDYIKFPEEIPVETEEIKVEELSETKVLENIDESINQIVDETVEKILENGEPESNVEAEAIANVKEQKEQANKDEKKIKNLGLSFLCQYMLGKPLDKTEQCSVWTRRPLRKLQIRYAALDAYSILMLYDRCSEWAEKLGMKIVDITDAQERINTPLPLFFDRTKLSSATSNLRTVPI